MQHGSRSRFLRWWLTAIVVLLALIWTGSAFASHAPPGTKLWGYEAAFGGSRILQYDIGTDTFDTQCVPAAFVNRNGRGIAFDPGGPSPGDDSLWITNLIGFTGDGFIHRVTLPPACTLIQSIPFGDGPGGVDEDDIGALDLDPDDGNIWAAGYLPPDVGNKQILYKVNKNTGQILRACFLPPVLGGGNDSLAVTKKIETLPAGKYLVSDAGEFTSTQQFVANANSATNYTTPAAVPPCQIVATGNTPFGLTGYDFEEPLSVNDLIGTSPAGAQITDFNGYPWSTIQATMSSAPSATLEDVTLRAQVGPSEPAEIILTYSPAHGPVNEVGTELCVIATVLDDQGQPIPGVTVSFDVEGSSDEPVPFGDAEGSATTGPDGMAEFCYRGPDLPGADTIVAFIDEDTDNMRDPDELQSNPLVKTWVLPPTTPGCEINISNGGWITTATGSKGSFGGNAKAELDQTVKGEEEYQDHGLVPVNIKSVEILRIVCDGETRAEIYGTATVNGLAPPVDFRIVVQDLGEPGSKDAPRDTYQIITGAYTSGPENNPLEGGNVQIHRFS